LFKFAVIGEILGDQPRSRNYCTMEDANWAKREGGIDLNTGVSSEVRLVSKKKGG